MTHHMKRITDMTEVITECFSALGAPARIFGRLPLVTRYLWSRLASPWFNPNFARRRYGQHYRWRPWLLFEVQEMQMMEELLNKASDERVKEFRQHQLESLQMVSVVVSYEMSSSHLEPF
jgi:hypothetical protein